MQPSDACSSEPVTQLIHDLLSPSAYTHAVSRIELRETHLSWVVLTGRYAYKIKKPVRFDFVDASTLERRRELCTEEVRLNRRLAPDLYLDVVAITRDSSGKAIVGGTQPAIEYAVRMHQFAEDLPALLVRDAVSIAEITALGDMLARFHRNADIASARQTPERTEHLYDRVIDNLTQLLEHVPSPSTLAQLRSLAEWTRENANMLEPLFELREQLGFVRECHGDLHAANIASWQGRLVPFDCIEFDPQLRWTDVIADLAFLVMDLIGHERPDLAFALLSRYLEVSGDYQGIRLLAFCAIYRALVRGKIDALAAEQMPSRAEELQRRLQRRIWNATSWTRRGKPMLVLMHGASGSGKSWLSERLVPELPAIRIRSDLERKRLAGLSTTETAAAPIRQGIYSPAFSHRTYARSLECAEHCLSAGFNTIVDAAFLDGSDRDLFRELANRLGVPCFIVACEADADTLADRIRERAARRTDVSDADLSVLDMQLREAAPFDEAEQSCVIAVDTRRAEAVERVVRALERRNAVITTA